MWQTQGQGKAAPAATSISPPTVIVIGAGIIGLTCAIKLQARLAEHGDLRGAEVMVVAREWPDSVAGAASTHSADYASMWAGAHVRPIPATNQQLRREAGWLRRTVAEFNGQVDAEPWCGITRTTGIELIDEPDEYYTTVSLHGLEHESGLRGFRTLGQSELPSGARLGLEYETFCINAPMYCEHLVRKFLLNGGRTMRRSLTSEWEAYTLRERVLLVVDASGVGFGDRKCFPTRGQTVLTDLSVAKTVTRQHRDGSWSFLIPRFFNGGTVVGGTKEPHDWRSEPDASTRSRVLAAGLALQPYAQPIAAQNKAKDPGSFGVLFDVVGRRPTRHGGMRLDVEGKAVAGWESESVGRTGWVIHAYGAGGRGFEMSWGVAEEVAERAMALIVASPWLHVWRTALL